MDRPRHITSDFSNTTGADTKTVYFKGNIGVVVAACDYPNQAAIRSRISAEGGQVKEIDNRVMEKTVADMRSTRDR